MSEDTVINVQRNETVPDNGDDLELKTLGETVYDLIKGIQDPEKPETLEELNVVCEDGIVIQRSGGHYLISITFIPTVPHCSLAPLIGLCLRAQLEKCLTEKYKLNIYIKEGTHATADEINKQINDKERIAAAMENPNLREIVQRCVENEGY